jgi:predicted lipoprotein with Yx(FWY)xxD motif
MINRLTRIFAVAALALAAAVLATGAVASSHGGAVVKLGHSGLGRIIADSHGRTLYLWTHDKRGRSSCYGKCAKTWPAFVTHGKPRAVSGARSALLGTTRRADGRMQVTYRRHPLYYFAGDRRAGQTGGEGLAAFRGRWYAVSAAGAAVKGYAMYPYDTRFRRPKLSHGLLVIEGTKASDRIALRLKAGDPSILQVDVRDDGKADFSFKRKHVGRIAIDARAGDDTVRIDDINGAFTDTIPTTIAGGDGNDTLAGGKGVETLLGGAGNDTVDGNAGNDLALLGAGDDTFVWDPGDGSDVVEGQDGLDTMRFNGANIADQVDLSANGSRLRFFRNPGNITMDTAGVERVDFNALGDADLVTVNDLRGTDVSALNLDLAGSLGGATGDGAADRVVVNGTAGNDVIDVSGDASEVKVSGLVPTLAIFHPEVANDRLEINTLTGNDTVGTAGLAAGTIKLFVNGMQVL